MPSTDFLIDFLLCIVEPEIPYTLRVGWLDCGSSTYSSKGLVCEWSNCKRRGRTVGWYSVKSLWHRCNRSRLSHLWWETTHYHLQQIQYLSSNHRTQSNVQNIKLSCFFKKKISLKFTFFSKWRKRGCHVSRWTQTITWQYSRGLISCCDLVRCDHHHLG